MNDNRFEILVDRLLENELSSEAAEELAAVLRNEPRRQRELRQHLVLWELWAQQHAPERSAAAFVAACQTRIRAERQDELFVADIKRRIQTENEGAPGSEPAACRAGFPDSAETSDAAGCGDPALQSRRARGGAAAAHGLFCWWSALQRPAAVIWTAVSAVAIAAVLWIAASGTAQATVTVRGEAVCTSCMLHETNEHRPAIRVRDGDATLVYYVESDRNAILRVGDYCMAPVPLMAVGHAKVREGRRLFDAESVAAAPAPLRADKQTERILFPF